MKSLKVWGTPADMGGMGQAFESAVKWLHGLSESAFQVAETAWKIDGKWYSGMAIEPSEFSKDLATLHSSLRECEAQQPVRRNQVS